MPERRPVKLSVRQISFLLGLGWMIAGFVPSPGFAADRTIQQFKHERWTLEDHAPSNIWAIVQARDGFLLLGAQDGVYRFDGVSFEHLTRPGISLDRNDAVMSMISRRSGDIWINYRSGPVGIYRNSELQELPGNRPVGVAYSVAEDRDGGIWLCLNGGNATLARYFN